MKRILSVAALLLGMLFSSGQIAAQNGEYRECLKSLLDKSGGLAASEVMMDQMIPAIQQMTSGNIPADFWTAFRQKWNETAKDRMVDLYVPIYQKYFTLDDLKEIIAFYDSPVGRKLSAATPAMTQEGMQMWQQLGSEIAGEMIREVQQKQGY